MKHFLLDSVKLRQVGSAQNRSVRGVRGDLHVPRLWLTHGLWLTSEDSQHDSKHADFEPATGQQALTV